MPVPIDQLLLFLPGSILITVVPGPDMALIMRQVFVGGTALAQRTIYGNLTGLVVHATALAVGLSALLVASAEAYAVVKLAGAAYLVYLGLQSLLSAWALREAYEPPSGPVDDQGASVGNPRARNVPSMRTAYLQGVFSTVLNPKPALLFLTFLPQFVDTTQPVLPQIMFLAGVHIVIGLVWLTIYAHLVHRAHRTLTRSDVKRWLEGATGVVLIALGLRVAVEPR
ncbi:MAG TPA: LysE family translocator [Candidatus Limnocylindrales bacterium]|nr:LysE family translocator [Candidatus Limnocylindrales bacterium]